MNLTFIPALTGLLGGLSNPHQQAPLPPLPTSVLPAPFHPSNLPLRAPALTLDFRIAVTLEPLVPVGPGPFGQRNWIPFSGGHLAATWATGSVVPGGQDSQLVIASDLSTAVETSYLIRTDDDVPAYITVKTRGWRHGPRAVMERLFDPAAADGVSPDEYSFFLTVALETGDERYAPLLNTGLWIGSGARLGRTVVYDAYRVA